MIELGLLLFNQNIQRLSSISACFSLDIYLDVCLIFLNSLIDWLVLHLVAFSHRLFS